MIPDFCQTMQFSLRRDVDKSTAEEFPQFFHTTPGASTPFDIYHFFKQYLQYCMNFGPDLFAARDREFAPSVKSLQDSAAGWSGPHFSGVFLCKKTPPASIQGDSRF